MKKLVYILLCLVTVSLYAQSDLGFEFYQAGIPGKTYYKGQSLSWNFIAKNYGDAVANKVNFKIVLSEDQTYNDSDHLLIEGEITDGFWPNFGTSGLGVLETNEQSDGFENYINIPLDIEPDKTYYFIFWIEQDTDGGEINISNNEVTQEVFIGVRNIVSVVAKDGSQLGIRKPLLLVHGWQPDNIPAKPNIEIWNNFVYYYDHNQELKDNYKIYYVRYWSNLVSIDDLGYELRLDLDNKTEFEGKQLSIVAHSMGGLVSRSFAKQSLTTGNYANQKGGARVDVLITLGTPHHGSPLSNGKIRGQLILLDNLLEIINELWINPHGPRYDEVNRSNLKWDNFDGLFTYTINNQAEKNNWLNSDKMNGDTNHYFDNKIIAYGGKFSDRSHLLNHLSSESYEITEGVLKDMNNYLSDGVVPLSSALFDNHTINKRREFEGYYHDEIAKGRADISEITGVDYNLFNTIKSDLLDYQLTAKIQIFLDLLEFHNTVLGNVTSKEILIKNIGDLPLTVTSVQLIGIDNANFNFNIPVPFDISANESKTVVLNFQPTTIGSKTINFRINNSSSNSPELTLQFKGEAINIASTDYSVNTQQEYNFGEVYSNGSSRPKIISILNSSSIAYTVLDIQMSGTDANLFSLVNPPTFPLEMNPGDFNFLTVSFSPDSIGNKEAIMTVTFEGTSITQSISLRGIGTNYIENPNAPKLVAYEYWFNNDYSNKNTVSFDGGNSLENINYNVLASGLERGINIFHFRTIDSNGKWSSILSKFIYKNNIGIGINKIVEYRYWFNTDFVNVVYSTISPNVSVQISGDIEASSLEADSINYIHFQFKDKNGNWSSILTEEFLFDSTLLSTENINFKKINIFPNPSSNTINITGLEKLDNSILKVYNVFGKLVFENKNVKKSFSLDISRFSKGIYLILIETKGKKLVKKMIKK